jgi:hypothetical protein
MIRPAPMTVGELIERLGTFDRSLPVLVSGYEGGMDYPGRLREFDASPDDMGWYYGRFADWGQRSEHSFRAVLVPR